MMVLGDIYLCVETVFGCWTVLDLKEIQMQRNENNRPLFLKDPDFGYLLLSYYLNLDRQFVDKRFFASRFRALLMIQSYYILPSVLQSDDER